MAFSSGTALQWSFGFDRERLSYARVVLVAVATLALLPVLGFAARSEVPATPAKSGSAQPAVHSLSSAPEGLRAAASAVIDANRSTYAVVPRDGTLTASGGGLSSVFGASGPVVRAGDSAVGLAFVGLSRGTVASTPGRPTLDASRNKVSYRRAGVTEWYTNGPRGLEQGFIVRHGPAADAAGTWLTVAVRASTGLRPSVRRSEIVFTSGGAAGKPVFRYGGLTAVDAAGRILPARLELSGKTLLLSIDDRDARYPLRIDPVIQQGSALNGTGIAGSAGLGDSVALSGDGNTALVGAPHDNGEVGAAWVFVRSGAGWTQQGPKLTASGEYPGGRFGTSLALSADGSTALIGAPGDNGGSVWLFTRTGTTWGQQGPSVTINGPGKTGAGERGFGDSVALSANGDTALIGAATGTGAAWLYARVGSAWTQLGPVLQPTSYSGAQFGQAVALSADGSVAAVGAPYDQGLVGGVWLFSVTDSGWTQDGTELTATGETPTTDLFGSSLALSSDGSTLLVGAIGGAPNVASIGAAYAFTRSGTTWSQQGEPLTPTDEAASGAFGSSVALSADGNTALIGGKGDNLNVGAAWIFTQSGSTWAQEGSKLLASGETAIAGFGDSVALSADGGTALIGGGASANGADGGAWTYTLSATTGGAPPSNPPVVPAAVHPFVLQGPELTAGDETGEGELGASVSLSADGNTALVGAPGDNGHIGAAWVFVRSGPTWLQQGPKLTATGETGAGQFGVSVALSGDGNTALIGADADGANDNGAAWVFTRSGHGWAQTTALVPTDEKLSTGTVSGGSFGASVALSADGSTALVGGPTDSGIGAAWIFVRNGAVWTQQGLKLLGLSIELGGVLADDSFGQSVALSSDGDTALIGAPTDSYFRGALFQNAGAAFVFIRTGNSWGQLNGDLDMHFTSSGFGTGVALSSDGKTAVVTGPASTVIAPDGTVHEGAAWAYASTNSVWGELGLIITPSDDTTTTMFGTSAAISGDGNTVFIGAWDAAGQTADAWRFDRSGYSWVQQGPKLTGGEIGDEFRGSVALSADGSAALLGAPADTGSVGAVWAFAPALPPDAPANVVAAASDGQATVSFTTPDSDGGEPITSYAVTASPGGATATGSSGPVTVQGLTDGITYSFTVTATNTVGTGPASTASNVVTPTAPSGGNSAGGGAVGGGGGAGAGGATGGVTPTAPPATSPAPVTAPKQPSVPSKPVRCVVPKLTSDTLAVAKRALSRAHCAVGRVARKHSAHVASGRIISESPKAGRTMAKGSKINLTVSTGKTKHA